MRRKLAAGFAILLCAVAFVRLPPFLFERLGWATSKAAFEVLRAILGERVSAWLSPQGYWMLSLEGFLARIGPGCWGLSGFFLFTTLLLFLAGTRKERPGAVGWFWSFCAAYSLVFAINVARIVALVLAGAWLHHSYGPEGTVLLERWLHPYLGWVFYGVGAFAFTIQWRRSFALEQMREPAVGRARIALASTHHV